MIIIIAITAILSATFVCLMYQHVDFKSVYNVHSFAHCSSFQGPALDSLLYTCKVVTKASILEKLYPRVFCSFEMEHDALGISLNNNTGSSVGCFYCFVSYFFISSDWNSGQRSQKCQTKLWLVFSQ